MRKRTKAREYALQILYQVDIRHGDVLQIIAEFWQAHQALAEIRTFSNRLVEGTVQHQKEIDQHITSHASNWQLNRMAVVDRNILRLGVFELRYLNDAPPTVCMNEAIELAKRFGDTESAKFVNGVLDAIYKGNAKPDRSPARPEISPSPQDS